MRDYKRILLVLIITLSIISCGRNKEENTSNPSPENEQKTEKETTGISKDTTVVTTSTEENETKGSVLNNARFTKKPKQATANENTNTKPGDVPEGNEVTTTRPNSTVDTKTKKTATPSKYTIQKILIGCKIGETLTQDELSQHLEIPKEAIKLVKSITKISEDEIDIKWNSTWLVEKVSDAKFKDGRLKASIINNTVYISGGAIAIKYDRKIYTDLVVKGRKAYIPTVEGYYWKIGNGKD
ncbi:hypothetical protein [Flavobacterium nackdongense]|uniref:Lipoprotein n=1 Tax=Flavobacterium nackdongense TaxID=2547394 RepID=A0A4P6YGE3_9FLAO|nr:hypothetical protein [Flavobacterium nackdongense]QBN19630.1 hypothetical protein E1750_12740 [Flavobacterium nackdongense]